MAKTYTIGHLAHAAGVNVETIRYYQRFGIITEPAKPLNGYRTYPVDTVERILFIRRAKELGFKLKEIAELLQLGDGNCSDVRQRAEEKRAYIDKQISDLKNLKNTLDKLITACLTDNDSGHCPIVETLTGK
jgi:MerR family mercuric resistance operon transcriptional regulator